MYNCSTHTHKQKRKTKNSKKENKLKKNKENIVTVILFSRPWPARFDFV
jgi:hypothetical protein